MPHPLPHPHPHPHPPRLRNALSAALIALACTLLLPFGALAAWATYEIGDTARYQAVTAPLADDPDVRDAIAEAVAAGIMREVRVGASLEGPTRSFTYDAVRSFTHTEAFRTAWDTANPAAHGEVLRALRGNGSGPVTLDIAPVTERVKRRLADDHVPFAHRIPVTHTRVTVLTADELDRIRRGYRMLEVAALWLPVTAAALAATGLLIATCRRRALLATGLGTALGGALLGLAVAVARHLTLADLPPDVSRAAAAAVYDALTLTLRTVTWALVGAGALAAAGAWLTGAAVRRRAAATTGVPVRPSAHAPHVPRREHADDRS
ncbi:hypothetical protein [Streptomyces sp. NPDC002845]